MVLVLGQCRCLSPLRLLPFLTRLRRWLIALQLARLSRIVNAAAGNATVAGSKPLAGHHGAPFTAHAYSSSVASVVLAAGVLVLDLSSARSRFFGLLEDEPHAPRRERRAHLSDHWELSLNRRSTLFAFHPSRRRRRSSSSAASAISPHIRAVLRLRGVPASRFGDTDRTGWPAFLDVHRVGARQRARWIQTLTAIDSPHCDQKPQMQRRNNHGSWSHATRRPSS